MTLSFPRWRSPFPAPPIRHRSAIREELHAEYPEPAAINLPQARIAPAMGPVSAQAGIDVPRPRVFAAIADLSLRPAFTDHFVSGFHLTRIASSGLGAGARFRFSAPPREVWVGTAIEELSEPHTIIERGRCGRANRVPVTIAWELGEGPGSLTSVRVSHWTEPSHSLDRAVELLGAASVWYERRWREALRRLRDLLEAGELEEGRVAVAGGNPHPTGIA